MTQPNVAISEFCRTGSGGTPSRAKAERYYGGQIPWVKSGELREGTITTTEETITEEAIAETAAKLVPAGALLVAMYGATVGRIGRLGIEAATNQAVCHIVPDPSRADDDYLFHALRAKVPDWLGKRVGGAQPNISQGIIRDTKIRLPPLPEQKRIAAILDKADAIRRKRQEAIRLTEELLRSAFLEMFGDPVTNPKGWPTLKIDSVCEVVVDCVNRTAPVVEFDTPYKMLRTTNVRGGRILLEDLRCVTEKVFADWTRRCVPKTGDVILTREAPVGEVGLLQCDAHVFLGQRLMLYRPNRQRLLPEYLTYAFMSPHLQHQFAANGSGSTVKHLPLPVCRSLEVRVPSVDVQHRFASVVQGVMRIEVAQGSGTQIGALLSQALQQRAFLGRP